MRYIHAMARRRTVWVSAMVAGMVGAAAAKPSPQRLVGVKLEGPAKSLAASCAALPSCGERDLIAELPAHPDCGAVASGFHHGLASGSGEVWIAPVTCAKPEDIHLDEQQFHVFVRHGDTWWHGGVLEQTAVTRNNWDQLRVSWSERDGGNRVVAVVEVTHTAMDCMRQQEVDHIETYDLVVDPRAATPIAYPALAVGDRVAISQAADPDDNCVTTKPSSMKLTERWIGSDQIELSGTGATGSAAGPRTGMWQLVAP
jgi:hypothetical protein